MNRDQIAEVITATVNELLTRFTGRKIAATPDNDAIQSSVDAIMALDGWQTIDSAPRDGTQKMFWSPLGGVFIAPDVEPVAVSRADTVQMIKAGGDWPNVGWNPTHWKPLDQPPGDAGRPVVPTAEEG